MVTDGIFLKMQKNRQIVAQIKRLLVKNDLDLWICLLVLAVFIRQ